MDSYFITGGTGTLGRAIIKRLSGLYKNDLATVTVFSRDPMRQASMPHYENLELSYVMGDITDYHSVKSAMAGHNFIIHAAAMKHIPQGEAQVMHTINANVIGSYNVALAALEHKVSTCTCISTDKVCYGINVYGATKFLMENIWREFSLLNGSVNFTSCRYGNVLGSNGSVLQVWQKQRAEGKPITITDPDHIRYWMTVDDAVDVVFEALFKAPNGVTVIPIVPALSIIELARLVTGEILGNEGDVNVIGERPGEKRIEWLLTDEESLRATLSGEYVYLLPERVERPVIGMRSDDAVNLAEVERKLVDIGVI